MRLSTNPLLPLNPDSAYANDLNFRLATLFRNVAIKVNGLADGALSSIDNALTAAPTTGTYAQGDFIRNSTPTEVGTAGSRYVVFGWLCTVGGTPGTFVQMRFLTGN